MNCEKQSHVRKIERKIATTLHTINVAVIIHQISGWLGLLDYSERCKEFFLICLILVKICRNGAYTKGATNSSRV
jgi:hypothetical protein